MVHIQIQDTPLRLGQLDQSVVFPSLKSGVVLGVVNDSESRLLLNGLGEEQLDSFSKVDWELDDSQKLVEVLAALSYLSGSELDRSIQTGSILLQRCVLLLPGRLSLHFMVSLNLLLLHLTINYKKPRVSGLLRGSL